MPYRRDSQGSVTPKGRTKNGTPPLMKGEPIIDIAFFRTESGTESVRDWLRTLSRTDKRQIGTDLKTVQYGWPLGMPVGASWSLDSGSFAHDSISISRASFSRSATAA